MNYKKAIADYLTKHQKGMPEMGSTLGDSEKGLQMLANQKMGSAPDAQGLPGMPMLPGVPPRPGQMPPPSDGRTIQGYADGTESVPPPQFDPSAGMPPTPPAPVSTPNSDVTPYIQQQKAQLSNYGPEQQLAVSQNLSNAQNSVGGRLASGGATLADALMQGVARAGNPGFANQIQQRQAGQANQAQEGLKNAREANIQNVGANEKLDAIDPNSPLSASKRSQNGPVLAAMGFNPAVVGKMSAAEMDTAMSLLKDFRGKDLETAVARYKAQIEANQLKETSRHNVAQEGHEAQTAAETMRHNAADEANKGEEVQTGALEKAAAVPLFSRLAAKLGMNPAQSALEQKAGVSATPPMTATNPQTGHKITSYDGGQTWK